MGGKTWRSKMTTDQLKKLLEERLEVTDKIDIEEVLELIK